MLYSLTVTENSKCVFSITGHSLSFFYKAIVKNTIQTIRKDFPKISAVFSINCLFRYLLFNENNYMQEYLYEMGTLGNHAGLVGYGEHYNNQFVNQSMACVVFE